MDDDDDKTLVGSPPATCCPNSPSFGPISDHFDVSSGVSTPSGSPPSYIKPALKKPVEYDPLKDLISYACEMLLDSTNTNGGKKIRRHSNANPMEVKQKKKSIRFSRNLEEVHYTPTHYTMRPSPPPNPIPARRRMSNPFFCKAEEENMYYNGLGINKSADGCYEQMIAKAKEQVKYTGKMSLPFAKDGSWIGGNLPDDEDDEFVMPPVPQLVRSAPRPISRSKSRGMPQRRSANTMPPTHTAAFSRKLVSPSNIAIGTPRNAIQFKHVTNKNFDDHETGESGVVERCVNIASNVKDVVTWCSSMLWNSTVF
ncbi:1572_t:CDS:1 [Diversispora eburnea]|uniref:1572_t:CDS:1 n=2 Tax=Diversisporales TaxID=214509 RepID=A0A9N8YMC7_9GLOM|nr:1572_t:CDS:1 [Diversispora eburnea]CAG8700926.1 23005_t:CDS:1 [Dentiscutata erythropus]